jgi:LPS sulfotransferase NodH
MRRSFFICASARTGSNLLASGLRETEVAGKPLEFFSEHLKHTPYMIRAIRLPSELADSPVWSDRREYIFRKGTTPNGIFGATVHWVHIPTVFATMGRIQDRYDSATLCSLFPELRFVWLRRENKVAQAISHYFSINTGRWQHEATDLDPHRSEREEVTYDHAEIKRLVEGAEYEEKEWASFLRDERDATLALTYEEFAGDYKRTVAHVSTFVGAPLTSERVPPPVFRRLGH